MRRERAAGLGLVGVLAAALLANLVFVARHCDRLRPVRAGDVASAIDLPALDGGRSDLAALRGRVVLLDFWATWCPGCREALPAVESLHERYAGRGLSVLSVNVDRPGDQARKVRAFVDAFRPRLTFPIYLDDGSAAARYRVRAIPLFVLIDRRGVIRAAGPLAPDALERQIRALLDEP